MGSVGKDESDTKNGGLLNSGFNNDDGVGFETQIFDSQSPEEIEDEDLNGHEYRGTLPVEDETQVLEEETQLLEEDLDGDENFRTQLILDECEEHGFIDSDGDGTDRTEVLSDAYEVSEDEFQRGKEEKELLTTGSEALIDERRNSGQNVSTTAPLDKGLGEPKPGFLRKSFMSVRSASLRASGLAAAQRIISKGTDTDPGCIRSNSHSRDEYIHKNKGTTDPAAIIKEIMEMDKDCETRNQNGNMQGFKDETKRKSAVRRLFTDDAPPPANNRAIADDDNIDAGRDFPELLNAHEFVGLSYVESQEPGELSQANALDTVDKFLSVNDVNLSQEVYPGKNVKEKSPSIPSAKGPHILAQRSNTRSSVCEVGIFDWVDSREDEGGGNFFSKKKEVLLTSKEYGRRSFTQSPKPRHLNFSKGKEKLDKLGGREEDLKFHQKIIGLTRSDSRLMLHNMKKDDNIVQISETKAKKNLFKELDKQLNPEPSEQQTEARVTRDSPDICDVGIDTQLAAEAMEALVCGVAANQDTDTTQVSTNTSEDCDRGVVKNKSSSEFVFRKRVSSDLGGISRKSKRLKKLDTKISSETQIPPRSCSKNSDVDQLLTDSGGKIKGKRGRPRSDHHLCNGNAANWYERSGRRSLKSVKKKKAVGVGEKLNIKEVDKCHSSSTTISRNAAFSKGQLQEECRTNTPIARHTRQSQAVNALAVNLFSGSGEGNNNLMKRETRTRSSMGVDAPESLTVQEKRFKMGSHQTGDVKKNKAELQESLSFDGPLENEVTNCYKKRNALSNPRGMVACRNRPGWLNECDQLDGSSKVGDLGETNGQSIGSACVNLMKRKTRSSIVRHPSASSEKYFEGNLRQQGAVDLSSANGAVNCSSAVTGKLASKDLIREKASMDGDVDSLSSPEVSPRGKVKLSGSACVTPINCTTRSTHKNVTTPINEASPLCIGNDYHKQSWKKSLSKSSLVKEFHKLGTDEIPTPVFKSLRKRKDMANVRVLFSHRLDEDIIKQQKKILTRMGVSIASSSSEATHFVTDKFVRTRNMLEAIALGKPVVTHLWLESCGQASCYIDEKNYILRDPRKEKEIGFSMPVSLSRACQSPLLEGKRVFITPNLKPDKEVIISLVKAVHGQAMERIGRSIMKDDKVLEELLVLSCEEDYEICVPFLEKGISVYSSELLLNGIVIQTLEYERHRLFNDHVRRTRSTIWFRKEDGDQFKPVVTKRSVRVTCSSIYFTMYATKGIVNFRGTKSSQFYVLKQDVHSGQPNYAPRGFFDRGGGFSR